MDPGASVIPDPPASQGPQPRRGLGTARPYADPFFFGLTCAEQEVEEAARLARGEEVPGREGSPEPEEAAPGSEEASTQEEASEEAPA